MHTMVDDVLPRQTAPRVREGRQVTRMNVLRGTCSRSLRRRRSGNKATSTLQYEAVRETRPCVSASDLPNTPPIAFAGAHPLGRTARVYPST
jgi:hypothetical protein